MSKQSQFAHMIAFQGEPGAYSQLACRKFFPDSDVLPCSTFEDVFAAVSNGRADHAMIPIENSLAGRVADIHHLLPESGLFITGEHFLPIHHQLLAPKGVKLEELTSVMSHTHALGQCRGTIRALGLNAVVSADTAGAARLIAERKGNHIAAIASALAAKIYDLVILKKDIEDAGHNTTRFLVMAAEPDDAEPGDGPTITSFIFNVRNVPAALYKAMGGFATNGVNMTKLESYQVEGRFTATQFYAEIEGHPDERSVRLALEELKFFTTELKVLGIYPADPYRQKADQKI